MSFFANKNAHRNYSRQAFALCLCPSFVQGGPEEKAGTPRFELGLTDPESVVLPLHHVPRCDYSSTIRLRAQMHPRFDLTIGGHWHILFSTNGAVAQLGERFNRTEEAVGSNPIGSTMRFQSFRFHGFKPCNEVT